MPNRQICFRFLCTVLALITISVSAHAAVVEGLYSARIAVDSQSQKNQNQGFREGLGQVLVKVRGNTDVLKARPIRQAMNRATQFVKSFSYDLVNAELYLSIDYDQSKIVDLLRDADFPVWGQRRPETLVWLAIEPEPLQKRRIMSQDSESKIHQSMTHTADQRGIDLVYPIWDLTDLQSLSVYDVWGAFGQTLSDASYRYGVTSILSARIYQYQAVPKVPQLQERPTSGTQEPIELNNQQPVQVDASFREGQWVVDWLSIENGDFTSGQFGVEQFSDIGPELINVLADLLANKYAIDTKGTEQALQSVDVTITNLSSLEKYVAVSNFLSSLSVVNTASLVKQQGSAGTFSLTLFGDPQDLFNALSLDKKIQRTVDEFGQAIGDSEFIWLN